METIEISDWEEARWKLNTLRKAHFVFRGQRRASWSLQTTLDRCRSLDPVRDERVMLEYFKRRAAPFLPKNLDVSSSPTVMWASLLQHYGGKTRLLDFTRSPYVAAFFAFEEYDDEPAVVYAIDEYPDWKASHAAQFRKRRSSFLSRALRTIVETKSYDCRHLRPQVHRPGRRLRFRIVGVPNGIRYVVDTRTTARRRRGVIAGSNHAPRCSQSDIGQPSGELPQPLEECPRH